MIGASTIIGNPSTMTAHFRSEPPPLASTMGKKKKKGEEGQSSGIRASSSGVPSTAPRDLKKKRDVADRIDAGRHSWPSLIETVGCDGDGSSSLGYDSVVWEEDDPACCHVWLGKKMHTGWRGNGFWTPIGWRGNGFHGWGRRCTLVGEEMASVVGEEDARRLIKKGKRVREEGMEREK